MNSIGSIIKRYREIQGLTQFHLAMELGISQSAYAHIESGTTKISIERAIQISQILKIDLNELLKSSNYASIKQNINSDENRLTQIEEKINSLHENFMDLSDQIKSLIEKMDRGI